MAEPQKSNDMPFMKYIMEGIPSEIARKAETELGETEEIKAECLKDLRSLIKNEPDLHACMEDAFLLRFLRTKKYKVDKAFKTLKNYYTFKATYSGIVTDFRPSDIERCLEMHYVSALEHRDSSFTGIGVVRIGQMDLQNFTVDDLMACILIMAEFGVSMESIQIAGYAIIFDFEGISLQSIRKIASPSLLYRIVTCIQDVIPCRIRGYHIVNQPYFFHILLTLAKTFMSEKLASRLHLHGTNMNSLYKHVPQEILPEELGGKQGPMSKYLKVFSKKIYSLEDYFVKMNKFGYKGKTLKELQKNNSQAIAT